MAQLNVYDPPAEVAPGVRYRRIRPDIDRVRQLEEANAHLAAAIDQVRHAAEHVSAWAQLPVQLENALEQALVVRDAEAYN